MQSLKATEKAEAIERLRAAMPPGTTVYTILRHVSRSGMMRHISVKTELQGQYDYDVSLVTDSHLAPHEGIKVGGCGMDMGFSLVYNLSSALYRSGYACLGDSKEYGKRCPSSFHQGEHYRDFTSEPIHHDGYALKQRWL